MNARCPSLLSSRPLSTTSRHQSSLEWPYYLYCTFYRLIHGFFFLYKKSLLNSSLRNLFRIKFQTNTEPPLHSVRFGCPSPYSLWYFWGTAKKEIIKPPFISNLPDFPWYAHVPKIPFVTVIFMKGWVMLDRRMWRQPLDLAYRLPVLWILVSLSCYRCCGSD